MGVERFHGQRLSREERKGEVMKPLKISLDFTFGPLWKDECIDGKLCTGISIVDNDEISEFYSSYYEFDIHGQACWFDEKREKADEGKMLDLPGRLNARLAELNDGSFEVKDLETPRIEAF